MSYNENILLGDDIESSTTSTFTKIGNVFNSYSPISMKTFTKIWVTIVLASFICSMIVFMFVLPTYDKTAHEYRSLVTREKNAPGCNLDCGRHGTCKFVGKNNDIPYCHCDSAWATFPEMRVGFHATCKSVNNQTICEAPLLDGSGKFVNARGPCSYARRTQVGVAVASWVGAGVGAEWFYMVDVRADPKYFYIVDNNDNKHPLPWNGGYIAGGFFAILTVAYAGFTWWINGIRCLIAPDATSIPFWDALGFAPQYTVTMWNRMDSFY
jgi:hypothetical protein